MRHRDCLKLLFCLFGKLQSLEKCPNVLQLKQLPEFPVAALTYLLLRSIALCLGLLHLKHVLVLLKELL